MAECTPYGRQVLQAASDQAALAAKFDLRMAREHAPSFDKLWRDVQRLMADRPR